MRPRILFIEQDREVNALSWLFMNLDRAIKRFNIESEDPEKRFTILLPAGKTADRFSQFLQRLNRQDLARVHFVQGEQLWPLPQDHPASLWGQVKTNLLRSEVKPDHIHEFDVEAATAEECVSDVMAALSYGVDYAIVGLNPSGAVAGIRDGQEARLENLDLVEIPMQEELLHDRESIGQADLPHVSLQTVIRQLSDRYWPDNLQTRPRKFFAPGWIHMLEAKEMAILSTGQNKHDALAKIVSTLGPEAVLIQTEGQTRQSSSVRDTSKSLVSSAEIALSRERSGKSTTFYIDEAADAEELFS